MILMASISCVFAVVSNFLSFFCIFSPMAKSNQRQSYQFYFFNLYLIILVNYFLVNLSRFILLKANDF